MIISIELNLVDDAQDQLQQAQAIAQRVETQFPWNGMSHVVERIGVARIIITWLSPLSKVAMDWIDGDPILCHWRFRRGGCLSIPNQTPTTNRFACHFDYAHQGQKAQLDVRPDCTETNLRINEEPALHIADDGELTHILQKSGIAQTGWIQTIWLCRRCDQPGATSTELLCVDCQDAYKTFMSASLAQLVEVEQTRTNKIRERLARRHEN